MSEPQQTGQQKSPQSRASSHSHHHHALHAQKTIGWAFFINLFVSILEIFGGLYVASTAILANALHDLGDAGTLLFGYFLERFSQKKRDDQFSYGYRRFSLLSALISGLMLLLGTAWVMKEAYFRFSNHSVPHEKGMFALAIVGFVANVWAALILSRGESHSEKMFTWHQIQDSINWFVAILVSIVLHFYPIYWLDPLLTMVLGVVVFWNVFRNLRETFNVLLQGIPEGFVMSEFYGWIGLQAEIHEVHDLHVWTLDGHHHVLSMHVVLKGDKEESTKVRKKIEDHLLRLGHFHMTIEWEQKGEDCHENCDN